MGLFCDTHIDFDEEEENIRIRKRDYKYQYDTSGRNAYNHRFLSYRYVMNLNRYIGENKADTLPQYKQLYKDMNRQLIYKNIGPGIGGKSLEILAKYLSRNLKRQAGDEKAALFDSNHSVIDEKDFYEVINKFSESFASKQFKQDNLYVVGLFENQRQNKIKLDDLEFDIWRVGTRVKFKSNFKQGAVITEVYDNGYLKIDYHTKDGHLSEYVLRQNVCPTHTPENFSIFTHSKANNPEKMLLANDDAQYSINKGSLTGFQKRMPSDFNHLTFSFGGRDYDKDVGHSAFRDLGVYF